MSANHLLIAKLDAFIRKYYRNLLLKGSIIFTGLFVLTFLFVSLLEYFGRYTSSVRATLFYSLLFISLGLLARFILYPLAQLLKLGKQLSHEQAAQIIGKHFSNISDKLLNTLQLLGKSSADELLLLAAIEQKSNELKPIPFGSAIDYKANIKYLRFAILPVVGLILILLVSPSLVSDGAQRVLQYDKTFKVPAPFDFTIENGTLEANQFQDFELKVKLSGKEIPNEVFVHMQNQTLRMQKTDATHFTFLFRNLQQSTPFFLEALGFEDAQKLLEVRTLPVMLNYSVYLDYPAYLNQKDEVISNAGDLSIPAGTTLKWQFTGKQTEDITLYFNKLIAKASTKDKVHFEYSRKFFLPDAYSVKLSNKQVAQGDSLSFQIDVVPDAFPAINIQEQKDSLTGKFIYFGGDGSDDHGLSKLTFNYKFLKSDTKTKLEKGMQTLVLPITPSKNISITHVFNLYEINFESSDEIEYYFELWDNDGVHGAKSTRSKIFAIKAPNRNEIKEQASSDSKALEDKMEEALKESKDLAKELKDIQRKLKSQQPLTWEEKKKLENLTQRQKDLAEKMEELQKDFKAKNQKEQAFKEEDKRIIEKQQELQKMYEELMTDEMKKLLKQMEEMMKQQNKELIKKELDKMELNNKDVEKELDRMLDMYKQLEVEKKMEDAKKDLSDLAKKQQELAKETEEKSKSKEELKQKQDELNKEFKDIQKDLKDLEKQNKELETPKDLANTKEEEKKIEEKMQKSSEDLQKGDSKKSSKEQKEATDELEKMSQKMADQQEKEEEEKAEVDEKALREILENLIQLSKDQENVMEQMKAINGYNPQFVQLAQEQKTIKDNAKMIEDSLQALSKNVPEIKSFVNREITKMNSHLDHAANSFSTRNTGEIRVQQQYAMTRMNNLGVMLSDALQQMQQQQQEKKNGKSKGKGKPQKKPGSGKPSMSQLKKMQEEMNKQMKEGMNKNGSGEKGKQGSEQFARMAAQQMAIRQQMQRMLSQMDALEKEKMGGGKQLGDLQKLMEETEKDLVNKRLTQETLMRQQEILTRLLEHEKAEKKQEEEQKRESHEGKEIPKPSPQYLEQFKRKNTRETELLQSVPVELQPYYKEKVKEYLEKE
ncbi:MAG: hypothetical protein CFE21_15220 [Bacteroidetes bacterium B1(2017)]|nr:MAG: hypothetical protein CFE21_15220 [Bacteroidetes bacterium B1(2017)]